MTPLTCPLPMPLWLRLVAQDRWDALRHRALAALGGVDMQWAVELISQAMADAEAAHGRIAELEKAGRAVGCTYCGEVIYRYIGDISPGHHEECVMECQEHDRECKRNPLVARIAELEALAIRDVRPEPAPEPLTEKPVAGPLVWATASGSNRCVCGTCLHVGLRFEDHPCRGCYRIDADKAPSEWKTREVAQ